jgi:hypothetical protein
MRRLILAAALAVAATASPGYSQQAAPVQATEIVATTEAEPIPVPEQKNKVSPGSFASATVGIGIVVIGLSVLAGAFVLASS